MKRMKFLMGVLACFLVTLTFGASKVSAAYATDPKSYFEDITLSGPKGSGDFPILDTMDDPNGDGSGADAVGCITFGANYCLDDEAVLTFIPVEGVKVTFKDGTEFTGVKEDGTLKKFTKTYKIDKESYTIEFTATIGSVTEDFSITVEDNKVCPPEEKTYCKEDPTQDKDIQACIDGGKDEKTCVDLYCKNYCTEDPAKDPDVKKCVYDGLAKGDKTAAELEKECMEKLCPAKEEEKTYCKEDPSKDKDVQKCIDEGNKEADCIQKICVQENPKTGITSPMIGGIALIALVVSNILIFRKREN